MNDIWDDSKVELQTSNINYYFEEGILMGKANPIKNNEKNILEGYEKVKVYLNGVKPAVYIDASNQMSSGSAERALYKKITSELYSKMAVYSDSPAKNSMINMYLGLIKPEIPIRLFHDQEKAIEWLKET